jgi:ribosomal-protein-alanine N-acetyltransferase
VTAAEELRTERLILRPIAREDLDAYAHLYADPEVVRYLGDSTTATREETAEWLDRAILRNEREGWDLRSVLRADDGEVLGRCGIAVLEIDGVDEREIGFVLGREHWGRGYATEAAWAMRDHAFGALGLTRLASPIHPDNEASKRVAVKIGMAYERDATFLGRRVELFTIEARPSRRPDGGGTVESRA